MVERKVMIKGDKPVRGTAKKTEENPIQQKTTTTIARKSNGSKIIDFCDSAVKSLRPCLTPKTAPHTISGGTPGQHCLVFNLA